MKRLALVALAIIAAGLMSLIEPVPPCSACAFPTAPTSYEGPKDRSLYLQAMDLAAFNMLLPGDPYFGLPRLEKGLRSSRSSTEPVIPPILLKSIGWIESVITQTSRDNSFEAIGSALISFDCGHGIMQVTSGMTVGLGDDGYATPEQLMVATHYAYNIARGAVILATKWNAAPENRPIAGTDTNSDPSIVENWYFAVWGYNGFTGPGANRSNHPMDPIYGAWPRTPYSCGPSNDGFGHNRGNYPYQELVWGCATRPPVVDGSQLWQPFPLSLPDLNDSRWREPLKLQNWIFPYSNMDIPTPWPGHQDPTAKPSSSLRAQILGSPRLGLSKTNVQVVVSEEKTIAPQEVLITNQGSGILSWMAVPSASWLQVSPPAGVAIGPEVPCAAGASCKREATITIAINPAALPEGTQTATVRIEAPGIDEKQTIKVTAASVVKLGVPGVTRN